MVEVAVVSRALERANDLQEQEIRYGAELTAEAVRTRLFGDK